jgi:ferredoxin-NADP reductase
MLSAVELAGVLVIVGALAQAAVGLVLASWRGARALALQQTELEVLRRRAEAFLQAARIERERLSRASGPRKMVIAAKVHETADVCSFELEPHDRQPLPPYLPGQYVRLDLRVPGQARPVVRCYSLSGAPRPDRYRITVKRVELDGPDGTRRPGLASCHLCDALSAGDIVDVRPPAGSFALDPRDTRPVVLIGGGIGITPLLAMVRSMFGRHQPSSSAEPAEPADPGHEPATRRETWVLYGIRGRDDEVAGEELRRLAREHPELHLVIAYSRPTGGGSDGLDMDGLDMAHAGRVDMELLRSLLPSSNYVFYICGPSGMMHDLTQGLGAWGVPEADIRFEAFGPASIGAGAQTGAAASGTGAELEVEFARSGIRARWTADQGTLLDLAEAHGIVLESGCRAGSCGSCSVAVRKGSHRYTKPPGADPGLGSCLTCVAVPDSPLVLDG